MFKPVHFGKKLPECMISFLKDYTDTLDKLQIPEETNISHHTIMAVANGKILMTERSAMAIERLIAICVENCGNINEKISADFKELKKITEDGLVEATI